MGLALVAVPCRQWLSTGAPGDSASAGSTGATASSGPPATALEAGSPQRRCGQGGPTAVLPVPLRGTRGETVLKLLEIPAALSLWTARTTGPLGWLHVAVAVAATDVLGLYGCSAWLGLEADPLLPRVVWAELCIPERSVEV